MMSSNIHRHSYVPFTGKSYIYYNGVQYERQHHPSIYQNEHPDRTIIRTNELDKTIINRVPLNGMNNMKDNLFNIYQQNTNYPRNNFHR